MGRLARLVVVRRLLCNDDSHLRRNEALAFLVSPSEEEIARIDRRYTMA